MSRYPVDSFCNCKEENNKLTKKWLIDLMINNDLNFHDDGCDLIKDAVNFHKLRLLRINKSSSSLNGPSKE